MVQMRDSKTWVGELVVFLDDFLTTAMCVVVLTSISAKTTIFPTADQLIHQQRILESGFKKLKPFFYWNYLRFFFSFHYRDFTK